MTRKPRPRLHDDPPRHDDARFEGLAAGELNLEGALVTGCKFVRCDLTEASLRGAQFSNCTFENCELGVIDLDGTVLSGVTFATCRLSGVSFEALSQLPLVPEFTFEGCDLSFTSFRRLDLKACAFRGSRLWESEFVGCDLTGVDFGGSDLARCTFARNDLAGADMRHAVNYVFSPATNNVRGLRVTLPDAAGLLLAMGVSCE